MYSAGFLPETNSARLSNASKNVATTASLPKASSSKGAFTTLMADVETRLLSLMLVSYEMMSWPSIVVMALEFLKERMGWQPMEIGRFASAHASMTFLGSLISPKVLNFLGSQGQVSLAHICYILHFILWGNARNGAMVGCALLPWSFAIQAQSVVMTRYVARAAKLGVGKGEAAAVAQSISAIGKMAAPILYMRLLLRAIASSKNGQQRRRLPLGMPMFFMAMLAGLQELLHRTTLQAQRKRELSEVDLSTGAVEAL
eukprot:gnl/MRDRNA2_/MRDRNA2_19238_c0_seq1.p1 gnl/MRDRNA2_/MRDRNA2_19238_c0~~gnl/MRDRNA2_/MRDRNA2_19238_c0_seq1.p1  ORF type:complete len:291 (+),score=37.44 gnl/MRDRNA2_/MRDRNA2_19238_c0_seq1:101-874(+)